MDIGVLGSLMVVADDVAPVVLRSARQRLLLAALLAAGGQTLEPGELAESRCACPPDRLDTSRFERLLYEARQFPDEPAVALERLERALAVWRGRAYQDFVNCAAIAPEATRLEELRLEAGELRANALLELGRPAEAASAMVRAHVGMWDDSADDDRAKQWARNVRADLKPWASDALYVNFEGDEGQDRVVAGLGAENCARLAAVKTQYDPDNVFHLNHNIKPA